jgi:predicted PurR-regulated permease PerM
MAESRQGQVVYRAILLAAGVLVLGLLFRQLVTLMLALLMTIIVAIPLSACATRLERRGLPRAVGALAGLLVGLAVLGGLLALIIPPFIDDTKKFIDDVPNIVDSLGGGIHDVTGADPKEVGDHAHDFLNRYVDKPERLIGPITAIGINVAGVLAALVLILITAFYMAVRPQPLIEGALRLFPPERREGAYGVMLRLRASWIGWMQGVLLHMLIAGVALYVALRLIGLDFAIVFAVLSGLFVVVPYFGTIVGAVPPILFALTDSPGKALLVLGAYVLIHQLEGNVIIPLVMARTVKLHPAVIAVGVVVVGQLFGFVGLIVAVPIISLIVILVEELWVKPLETAHAQRASERIELPSAPESEPEREPSLT